MLRDVASERQRQHDQWGDQDLDAGCSPAYTTRMKAAQDRCDRRIAANAVSWYDVALEEFYEFFAEMDEERRYVEAVQNAAVWTQIAESIKRNQSE